MRALAVIALGCLSIPWVAATATPPRDVVSIDKISDYLLKNYPEDASKARLQGTVGFRLSIAGDGMPAECVVTKSSGVASLDDATCALITQHVTFPPISGANPRSIAVTTTGLIKWRLPDGRNQSPILINKKTTGPDRMICKVTDHTGSLIPVRVCKAATEWADIERETKSTFIDAQGRGWSCGGGGTCPESAINTGPGH